MATEKISMEQASSYMVLVLVSSLLIEKHEHLEWPIKSNWETVSDSGYETP